MSAADRKKWRIVVDERPRCNKPGPFYGPKEMGRVPCEREEGHKGMHQWQSYGGEGVRWR